MYNTIARNNPAFSFLIKASQYFFIALTMIVIQNFSGQKMGCTLRVLQTLKTEPEPSALFSFVDFKMISVFLLAVFTCLVIYKLLGGSRKERIINKLPGPRAYPIVGNMLTRISPLDGIKLNYFRYIKVRVTGNN